MRLLPRADGLGRVPAVEVMVATNYIRDCIENKEKTKYIHDAIKAGTSQYGMQTFDQSLFQLYKSGPHHARGGDPPLDEPERVQAQDPGDPVHLGRLDRADGGLAGGAGDALRGGLALRLLEPAGVSLRARETALALLSRRAYTGAALARALVAREHPGVRGGRGRRGGLEATRLSRRTRPRRWGGRWQRKSRALPAGLTPEARSKKLFDHLVRRGFAPAAVLEALRAKGDSFDDD